MSDRALRRKDLRRPASRGVGRIALGLLGEARKALARMEASEDAEALHDFRVAIRRLRSTLASYRAVLGRKKKVAVVLAGLGRVQHASNRARDAEVQIEWIERRLELDDALRLGLAPLRGELEALNRSECARLRRRAPRRFADVEADLQRLLDAAAERSSRKRRARGDAFGVASAERIRDGASALASRTSQVRGVDDVEAMHRARIAAKRLRYLIEPTQRWVPESSQAIAGLKRLQEQLGDLNDLRVLRETLTKRVKAASRARAEARLEAARAGDDAALRRAMHRAEEPALLALDRRIEACRRAGFVELEREWLAPEPPPLASLVEAIADALIEQSAQRGLRAPRTLRRNSRMTGMRSSQGEVSQR